MWKTSTELRDNERKGIYIPCDAIREFSCSIKTVNKDILFDALTEGGYNPRRVGDEIYFTYDGAQAVVSDGELTIRGRSQAYTNEAAGNITRQCTSQIVKQAAKKFGWSVTQTSKNKLKLRHH